MNPKLKNGDRVMILPHQCSSYEAIEGCFATVVGVGPDFGFLGPSHIILFDKPISDDYPWTACIVLESYLRQI